MPEFPLVIEKGSVWCWEPLNPALRCEVQVISAEWTGDQWYIEFEALEEAGHWIVGQRSSYELNWFMEVSVLVSDPRGSAHSTRFRKATIELKDSSEENRRRDSTWSAAEGRHINDGA
jgi:hypothetical protein